MYPCLYLLLCFDLLFNLTSPRRTDIDNPDAEPISPESIPNIRFDHHVRE